MATQVGDIVRTPDGQLLEVVSVEDADAYVKRKSREQPHANHNGSSLERCALYGTTKGTTAQERRG